MEKISKATTFCKFYSKSARITGMSRALAFFNEVKVELTKVVWPTKEATIRLTLIVILVTVMVSFFVGIIDAGLAKLFEQIIRR